MKRSRIVMLVVAALAVAAFDYWFFFGGSSESRADDGIDEDPSRRDPKAGHQDHGASEGSRQPQGTLRDERGSAEEAHPGSAAALSSAPWSR